MDFPVHQLAVLNVFVRFLGTVAKITQHVEEVTELIRLRVLFSREVLVTVIAGHGSVVSGASPSCLVPAFVLILWQLFFEMHQYGVIVKHVLHCHRMVSLLVLGLCAFTPHLLLCPSNCGLAQLDAWSAWFFISHVVDQLRRLSRNFVFEAFK